MLFSAVGGLIAPPLGNSLSALSPGLSFVFWTGAVAGLLGIYAAKEPKAENRLAVQLTHISLERFTAIAY